MSWPHALRPRPVSIDRRKSTRNKENTTFAIPAAATASPVNPNTAATIATIKKMSAQFNMSCFVSLQLLHLKVHCEFSEEDEPSQLDNSGFLRTATQDSAHRGKELHSRAYRGSLEVTQRAPAADLEPTGSHTIVKNVNNLATMGVGSVAGKNFRHSKCSMRGVPQRREGGFVKLALGVILMVLGIIGIARGSVGYATAPQVPIGRMGENSGNVPVAPLASSVLFVGGLIILAKTVKLRVEDL